jgi:hypothetical protein
MRTCIECGETKKLTYFSLHHARCYRDMSKLDPRRRFKRCKRCCKPLKPGQKREDVPEVMLKDRKKAGKGTAAAHRKKYAENRKAMMALRRKARLEARRKAPKKKKRKKRSTKASREKKRLARMDEREATRIHSMLYLARQGCEECGERDPRVLEYDHKDPSDKKHKVSRLIISNYSWNAPVMRAEVAKCRVLCANCHRRHTVRQQSYHSSAKVQRVLGALAASFGFNL